MSDARAWVLAVGGGLLVALGAALPWISLFAGLHRYPGLVGLYGRVVFAGGAAAVVAGAMMRARPDTRLRPAAGVLGLSLAAFIVWLLLGLRSITHHLAGEPMLIARPGPGLFVALAGALVLCALLSPELRRLWRARS